MKRLIVVLIVCAAAGGAKADVFDMGPGLQSLSFVTVGNPSNAPDTRYDAIGFGAVGHVFLIGKYEVTAGQYTAFLNAVAATDTYGLYNMSMWSCDYGAKIQRIGSSGSYTYIVAADRANRPVSFVSWGDAARFINWLHNGQPTGAQGSATTEDGAYFLNGANDRDSLMAVTRKAGAKYYIPSEDEWYKAAYHKNDGTDNYSEYPTSSDSFPSNDLITPDPGNNANFFHRDQLTLGSPYYFTEVGEFENSESAYGTFDQGGNVWEWNETALLNLARGMRGGDWASNINDLKAATHVFNDPMREDEFIAGLGFRVAASVREPAIITCDFAFYNNSSWDEGDEAANTADDDAIAIDKMALPPGQRATFANYTNYSRGINGLMIDMRGLPSMPTLNDFLFRKGNDSKPYGNDLDNPADDWSWADDPIEITVRPGEGQDGTDRVTLIWADGVIRNCWLQVTVLATDATGLVENEVFYFGNATGDSGNSTTDTLVNATDEIGARNNPHSPLNPASSADTYDFNRDKLVNATDQIIARNNRTSPLTALKLITPPLEPDGEGE